jgi:DNA-binding response OmpR family regulator
MSKRLQIFLAEDNPGDVDLVRLALHEHKVQHELTVAKDGAAASRYIARMGTEPESPCPDCILLDLNLPNGDGFELFGKFRRHEECLRTPVIIVTSSDSPKDRKLAADLGVSYYFRKPSNLAEFLKLGAVIRQLT